MEVYNVHILCAACASSPDLAERLWSNWQTAAPDGVDVRLSNAMCPIVDMHAFHLLCCKACKLIFNLPEFAWTLSQS